MKTINLVARIECGKQMKGLLGVPIVIPFYFYIAEEGNVYVVYDWEFSKKWGSYLKEDWKLGELIDYVAKEINLEVRNVYYYEKESAK